MQSPDLEKAALRRAAFVLGGQVRLAAACGYARKAVWQWFQPGRRVPAEVCPLIERETRNLGATVTCEELRPDVSWDVLRVSPDGETPVESKAA